MTTIVMATDRKHSIVMNTKYMPVNAQGKAFKITRKHRSVVEWCSSLTTVIVVLHEIRYDNFIDMRNRRAQNEINTNS